MFLQDMKHFATSVIAWIEAPYFTRSSMTLMRFFLQAMCSGVKPFCAKDSDVSQENMQLHFPHSSMLAHWEHKGQTTTSNCSLGTTRYELQTSLTI